MVDLVSDTATTPSQGMRRAMAAAPVGDEQRGEDPTVNALCERVAHMLGKEHGIFLPSGTMCNQIALLVHCRPGDEVLAADASHIITSEGAGAAALAGAFVRPLSCSRGVYSPGTMRAAIRSSAPKSPRTRLVVIEQTHNQAGGCIWPVAAINEVATAARESGLAVHMDGARLLNAVVATGVSAHEQAGPVDSVWLDLSKGLGCPVGGVLAGDAEFIDAAWLWKHRLGGAMRQAGILAAAGLYALENNIDRLAEDHANARAFAERVTAIPGVEVETGQVDTNLVFLDVSDTAMDAATIAGAMTRRGFRIGVDSPTRMRVVTHLDVGREDCLRAADELTAVVDGSGG